MREKTGKKHLKAVQFLPSVPCYEFQQGSFQLFVRHMKKTNMLLLVWDIDLKLYYDWTFSKTQFSSTVRNTGISRRETRLESHQWISKNKLTSRMCDRKIRREQLEIWKDWKKEIVIPWWESARESPEPQLNRRLAVSAGTKQSFEL